MIALIKTFLGGWKLYALAGVIFLAAVIGAYVKGRMDGSDICTGRIASAAADYDVARDKAVAEAEARRALVARHFVEIDTRYTKEMADAQAVQDRLRRDVASGRRQLLVAVRCPAAPGVPGTGPGAGVGPAAAPRLEGAAVEDYHTLVGRLEMMESQLRAAQEALIKERAP